MPVEFAQMLRGIVNAAIRDSRAELRFALGIVADVILDAFDSNIEAVRIDRRSASDALEIAHAASQVADACYLIESRLLVSDPERCFLEFELPADRSYDALSRFLERSIVGTMTESSFVYVVWNRNPAA